MYEAMRLRNYSDRTIKSYLSCISLVSRNLSKSPDLISSEELKGYLLKRIDSEGFLPPVPI
ncbi:phage integrase N-terminal SAM-like domain-containing protein [Algoriphagus halophilus]|uniref:phage integrase N-terminal SAM-like domain-containing protein n=1 Tax=Algoriphagus halophilus TaxID=226505 RepID=UPI00358FF02C